MGQDRQISVCAGWVCPSSPRPPPLHLRVRSQVAAFAAAVKRREKPAELNRMLSPFTAGDYTRAEFNALYAHPLNAERAPSQQIGPEKLVQATRPTPSNPTTLRTQHTHRHGARVGWRLTPPCRARQVSKDRWRHARRHLKTWGAGAVPEAVHKHERMRMSQKKLESAL